MSIIVGPEHLEFASENSITCMVSAKRKVDIISRSKNKFEDVKRRESILVVNFHLKIKFYRHKFFSIFVYRAFKIIRSGLKLV